MIDYAKKIIQYSYISDEPRKYQNDYTQLQTVKSPCSALYELQELWHVVKDKQLLHPAEIESLECRGSQLLYESKREDIRKRKW